MSLVETQAINSPARAAPQRHYEAPLLERFGGCMNGSRALEVDCGRGVGVEIILDRFREFAVQLLARFVGDRHHQERFKHGWDEPVHQPPDQMGLPSLYGIVVAPRPNKPWRERPSVTR